MVVVILGIASAIIIPQLNSRDDMRIAAASAHGDGRSGYADRAHRAAEEALRPIYRPAVQRWPITPALRHRSPCASGTI